MVAVGSNVQVLTTLGPRVGTVIDVSFDGYHSVRFPGEPRPVHCSPDAVGAVSEKRHSCLGCGYLDECPKWCNALQNTKSEVAAFFDGMLPDPQVEPSVAVEATREAGPLSSGAVMHKNAFDIESLQQAVNDPVSSPAHYCLPSGIECWDVIDELGMGFLRGSAFEHIWRAGRRGGAADEIADLRKAIRFLQREIASLEAEAGR